jgi:hypothetical protein
MRKIQPGTRYICALLGLTGLTTALFLLLTMQSMSRLLIVYFIGSLSLIPTSVYLNFNRGMGLIGTVGIFLSVFGAILWEVTHGF